MRNIETEPVEMPSHVAVVPLRAAFAVECSRCRETVWLYHVAVFKNPKAIAQAVEAHRGCAASRVEGEGPEHVSRPIARVLAELKTRVGE